MDNKETLINHIEDNIPKLRFPEFTDPWKQRKVEDVVNVYDGVHKTPDYTDGGIMFLSVENISTLKSEKYISEESFNRDFKVYPKKGDVLMTRIGDIGTPNVVETTEKVAYYVSLALLKPIDIDSYFLCNSILSPFFQNGLKKRTLITAIPQKINKDEIGKVTLFIPTSIDEQRKIGVYFTNIDQLITLHQRKLILLNKYKRGLLFKIFTSFNRDNLISLKELIDKNVIEIKRGNIIPKQYGIYPVYSSSVHNNGLFCYSDNYMFDEELVSWSIDGGGNFFYRPKHKFSLTNVSGYIRVKDKNILNTQYLYYNLDYSSCNYNFDYQNKALPSYISKLYQIYLLDIKIQNKVSTILSSFDFIIKKEEQILLQLKQYKQGLLQQMFI